MLGLGLGIKKQNSIFAPSGYDPDALAFAALSGATDIASLSSFCVAVKALGLWSNLMCWPARSAQNAGTGVTLYALGGAVTVNSPMTLINGPTWSANGLIFAVSGSPQYAKSGIDARSYLANGTASLVAMTLDYDANAYSMVFGQEGDSDPFQYAGMIRQSSTSPRLEYDICCVDDGGITIPVDADATPGAWQTAFGCAQNGGMFFQIGALNDSYPIGGSLISDPGYTDTIGFAAREGATDYFAIMTAAFGAFFTSYVSEANIVSFNTIYKNTLGSGITFV
jgi:hypothetical protein